MKEGLKLPMLNGMGRTSRIDNWWAQPAVMGFGLILAMLWTFWRVVFFSDHIDYDINGAHVISPMFSPNVLEWDMFSGINPVRGMSTGGGQSFVPHLSLQFSPQF